MCGSLVGSVVTTLSLRNNSIGDKGAKAIAEALKVNAVLKNCNLLKNRLDVVSRPRCSPRSARKGASCSRA
jgi:hypothetical protein